MNPKPLDSLGKTISLKDAQHLTKEWRNFLHKSLHVNEDTCLKAVYIPISDIQSLASAYKAEGVRAYLCLELHKKPDLSPSIIKLVLVPVVDGKDVIQTNVGDGGSTSTSIYDLTLPCPAQCDPTSPLY